MRVIRLHNANRDHYALNTNAPTVAILLCTYNGAQFVSEQLDSFERQTHRNWRVWASDDGSTDETVEILRRYKQKWGSDRLVIIEGPRAGSTRNFLSLTHHASIEADFYAFSDQDDIWEADKLQRAVSWLQSLSEPVPSLYCSRTRFVDDANQEIGLSQLFSRPPSFANALMQNIAGGNTMVFNEAARSMLGHEELNVVIHDWWVYLAVTGCGGKVFYDPYPSLRYRQHDANLIGMNSSWNARLVRVRKLFKGHFREWTDRNIAALRTINESITPQNQELLARFAEARTKSIVSRVVALPRLGLYRQTTLGNLGLVAAAIFNKL